MLGEITNPCSRLDDAETRVVRRTTTTPVRNINADRPWTASGPGMSSRVPIEPPPHFVPEVVPKFCSGRSSQMRLLVLSAVEDLHAEGAHWRLQICRCIRHDADRSVFMTRAIPGLCRE